MSCACSLNLSRRAKEITAAVVLALIAAPLLGAALFAHSGRERDSCHAAVAAVDALPAHELDGWSRATVSSLDGSRFAMTDLVGRPAVLYFWATWCPQCKVQREVLTSLAGPWGDRVRIAALSLDDDASAAGRYLDGRAGLTHELRASRELLELFHVEALPTLVVIDAKGQVKAVSDGPMDAEQLRGVVEPLLK